MSTANKSLKTSNVSVTPYVANKAVVVGNTALIANGYTLDQGLNTSIVPGNVSTKAVNYHTVASLFYNQQTYTQSVVKPISQMTYDELRDYQEATASFNAKNYYFDNLQSSAASGTLDAMVKNLSTASNTELITLSIPQIQYGEKVQEGSLAIGALNNSYYIVDDGNGNLVDIIPYLNAVSGTYNLADYTGSILTTTDFLHEVVKYTASGSLTGSVGNVFYGQGLAVITNTHYLNILPSPTPTPTVTPTPTPTPLPDGITFQVQDATGSITNAGNYFFDANLYATYVTNSIHEISSILDPTGSLVVTADSGSLVTVKVYSSGSDNTYNVGNTDVNSATLRLRVDGTTVGTTTIVLDNPEAIFEFTSSFYADSNNTSVIADFVMIENTPTPTPTPTATPIPPTATPTPTPTTANTPTPTATPTVTPTAVPPTATPTPTPTSTPPGAPTYTPTPTPTLTGTPTPTPTAAPPTPTPTPTAIPPTPTPTPTATPIPTYYYNVYDIDVNCSPTTATHYQSSTFYSVNRYVTVNGGGTVKWLETDNASSGGTLLNSVSPASCTGPTPTPTPTPTNTPTPTPTPDPYSYYLATTYNCTDCGTVVGTNVLVKSLSSTLIPGKFYQETTPNNIYYEITDTGQAPGAAYIISTPAYNSCQSC